MDPIRGDLVPSDRENQLHRKLVADSAWAGKRVDKMLARQWPDLSRGNVKQFIEKGELTVNGAQVKPSQRLTGGELILLRARREPVREDPAQPMGLTPVFEDEHVIVMVKPAGLVVHPGAGNRDGTLLNGLLAHRPELRNLPRAGIVHRLDKDTSGLMMVAASELAYQRLVADLAERKVAREYLALVRGTPVAGHTIDAPIGRHRGHRTKMAVTASGKSAVTHFSVLEKLEDFALLSCRLETGRTHQIRVHLAHIELPIIGDATYGGKRVTPEYLPIERQALHAVRLAFEHPQTGKPLAFESELPADIEACLDALRQRLAPQGEKL